VKSKCLTVALLLVSAIALGQTKTEKVQFLKALEKGGKTVATHTAPNKKTKLVVRDHNEVGDFVWKRLFLVNGTQVVRIDAFNEVSRVKWEKDSKSVQFRGVKATDYNEISHFDVKYTVGAKTAQYKLVKREKFEGGG
jgi:hypothetical protein